MFIDNFNLKMLLLIKLQLNIFTNIAIRTKNNIKNNEMKHSFVYRPIKEIFQSSSKCNIIQKNINKQLLELKTNNYRQQQKSQTMDNNNENQTFLENHNTENGTKSMEKRLDKENDFKPKKYDGNDDNNNNKTFDSIITPDEAEFKSRDAQLLNESYNNFEENKKNQKPHRKLSNDHDDNCQYEHTLYASYNQYPSHINISNQTSENIDPEKVQDILLAEGDGEVESVEETDNNNDARLLCIDHDLVNNISQNNLQLNGRPEIQHNEDNVTLTKNEKTQSQPLAPYVETQTLATSHVQNVNQHLNQRHLVTDLRQQINVHNKLDVANNLCAIPIGALCDMAAFSKLDCSLYCDFKDQDFLVKKYNHPLYAHGVCRWPGCELPLDDMASFVK